MQVEDASLIFTKFEQYLDHKVDVIINRFGLRFIKHDVLLKSVETKFNSKKETYTIRVKAVGLVGKPKLEYMCDSVTKALIYRKGGING